MDTSMDVLVAASPVDAQGRRSLREHTSGGARRFVGRVAVVTGASPRGIGGAIATRLVREGARVSVLCRHRPVDLIERLAGKHAGAILWNPCDIGCPDQIARAVDRTLESFGLIDVLVNNAGLEDSAPVGQMAADRWQELLDVNLTGAMRVTQAVLPQMEFRGGVIVNISSVAGMLGVAGRSAYSATKAALIGWTQSAAVELAPRRIRVVGVAPAVVKTPMTRRHAAAMTEADWKRLQECHPLGVGTPADVAAAVAFLASDEARWITGVMLPLGWTASFCLGLGTS
jgi:NAD(P)-dependent dehydrogenase (short-subunit alcohol dehydrogenase family)